MPSFVIANTVQLRLLWRYTATPWAVNVLHFIAPGGFTVDQAAADTARTQVQAAYTSGLNFRGSVSTQWALNEIGLRDIRVANQPEYRATLPSPAGTNGTDPLSPVMTSKVMLRTALAGKRYRGAVFLPGWTEAASTAGLQAGATTATGRGFIVAIQANMQSALGLTLAVASQTNGTSQPVTAPQSLNSIWSIQRRRRDGLAAF